jgi:general stress protein YciG
MLMPKGKMTVSEAGRKGGLSTSKKYGPSFYEEIGHKGGIIGGPKGGQTTKRKYGHEFYEEIGHKGGQKVKDLINRGKRAR